LILLRLLKGGAFGRKNEKVTSMNGGEEGCCRNAGKSFGVSMLGMGKKLFHSTEGSRVSGGAQRRGPPPKGKRSGVRLSRRIGFSKNPTTP